jgi:hypothetical protein
MYTAPPSSRLKKNGAPTTRSRNLQHEHHHNPTSQSWNQLCTTHSSSCSYLGPNIWQKYQSMCAQGAIGFQQEHCSRTETANKLRYRWQHTQNAIMWLKPWWVTTARNIITDHNLQVKRATHNSHDQHTTVSQCHCETAWTLKCTSKAIPHNRPWRPIGLWDVKDPTLSRQSAHS